MMRYLGSLALALAMLASPMSGTAQSADEDPTPDASEVAPTAARTFNGHTREELELRKRKAAYGLIAPAALVVAGVPLLVRGTTGDCAQGPSQPDRCDGLRVPGIALTVPGAIGMVAASILVGVRKGELNVALRDYTLEEAELRVKRARIGLVSTGAAIVAGGAFLAVALAHQDCGLLNTGASAWCGAVASTALTLIVGGAAGVIATGVLLRVRKKQRREVQRVEPRKPPRARWDPARSCLVF